MEEKAPLLHYSDAHLLEASTEVFHYLSENLPLSQKPFFTMFYIISTLLVKQVSCDA